jgi:hypothetical protein
MNRLCSAILSTGAAQLAFAFLVSCSFEPIAHAQGSASVETIPSCTISGFAENMMANQHRFSLTPPDQPAQTLSEADWPIASFSFFSTRLSEVARRTVAEAPDRLGAWLTPGADEKAGGSHFEGGIAPHVDFGKKSARRASVILPVNVGFGDQEYWVGHQFGYVSGGINVRVPLSFLPARCGKWTAGTDAEICYYGTTTAEFMNAVPSLGAIKLSAVLRTEL